ncbi:hypothetical protein Ahy_B01g056531 isoform D [Arachis hypogaea]|uniref:Uncharacterized protein n=1 Tax=Arachis hypogaea TaxID=3818 RepID=A0A445AZ21_ARAHY|nr:hypothetical protein Ahy_B01g056531 isoform D [Arachis hypogaea]
MMLLFMTHVKLPFSQCALLKALFLLKLGINKFKMKQNVSNIWALMGSAEPNGIFIVLLFASASLEI